MAIVQEVHYVHHHNCAIFRYVLTCRATSLSSSDDIPETLLYGFIVPILSYMLEDRLHLDATRTQSDTTRLLAIYGFMSLISAPIVGHIADKTPNKRTPLLVALAGCLVGTVLVACTPSRMAYYQ